MWNFFDDYPYAEVALSTLEYKKVCIAHHPSHDQVRILSILGNTAGIQVNKDRALLQQLEGTDIHFLQEPTRAEFDDHLWDELGWDVLFFAGHSSCQEDGKTGKMQLNETESLSIAHLRLSLKTAISRGLKLAIFNSCEGMGLAQELANLHIPYLIVMREPVPDQVAQQFLMRFLTAFAKGMPFTLAVREARERLQGIESRFPCASWLPVICQNPSMPMLYWHTLSDDGGTIPESEQLAQSITVSINRASPKIPKVLPIFVVLLVTCFTIAVRILGFLEPLELLAYDHLVSLRSGLIQSDNRAFAILIDEEDIKYQRKLGIKGEGSLSDEALIRTLKTIEPYNPRVIGLDIIHDFPFQESVEEYLQGRTNFFGVCEIGAMEYGISDTDPPLNLSPSQIGFISLPLDKGNFIRRQFLGMTPGESCKIEYSLSFQMALKYLEEESSDPNWQPYHFIDDTLIQIKSDKHKNTYKSIGRNSGGYRLSETADLGFQTLTNYSHANIPHRQLREVLELKDSNKDNLKGLIENKMIFIGVDIPNIDQYKTPLNRTSNSTTPGVIIHAQMASSILDGALDGISPIRWWPESIESLWILLWSASGVFIWFLKVNQKVKAVLFMTVVLSLHIICFYAFLLTSLWIPLIPALIGLIVVYFFGMVSTKQWTLERWI